MLAGFNQIFRLWVVWQTWWVLVLPIMLLCSMAVLLILRIWQVNSKAAGTLVSSINGRRVGLLSVMLVIIDGASPYSIALFVAFVAFMVKSNGQFVVLES
ncbi:hypothetical protein OF83DRAFT_1180003 [Amylostereum chailletii]|nr:hypothetical protein OF83DRAFT_1180003 [Amylostereum chailletii]